MIAQSVGSWGESTYRKYSKCMWSQSESDSDTSTGTAYFDFFSDAHTDAIAQTIHGSYCRVPTLRSMDEYSFYSNCSATSTSTDTWRINWPSWSIKQQKTPMEKLREIMHKRQSPGIIVIDSKRPMASPIDIREQRARETLARLLGSQRYCRFLKSGFVSVQNRYSGKVYQIFPGNKFTNVYENGKQIATLCVVFNKNFPPTDSIIMRYLLAINDEEKLWSLAIKHPVSHRQQRTFNSPDLRSLPDILRAYKGVA